MQGSLGSRCKRKKWLSMQVRSLVLRKQILKNKQENFDRWITLGHPDELVVSTLKPMALRDIKAGNDLIYCRDSEQQYHHVIYLIDHGNHSGSCGETDDSALWDEGLGFLSITRIHFPVTTDLDRQFNELRAHFKDLARTDVAWRVYGTTELSDQVLVCRCRSFKELSRWSLQATSYARVGKAYTYFCIPNSIMESAVEDWKTEGDCIEQLSMRFAVKDCRRAPEKLKEISTALVPSGLKPLYYRITGNEDAIICGENVPIEYVVNLYRTWYQEDLEILDVFSNIISRIGANVTVPDSDVIPPDPLTGVCVDLLNKITHCKNIPQDCPWRRPLIELSNTLVHMSRSSILDELVYLILPGLYAFWENIEMENQNPKDNLLYQQFVELCVHTIEHLMRAEGQLSQYPEVRPITYDIPVFAFEVAIAFSQQINGALTAADTGGKNKTSVLLVPSAEIDVSTVELFPASKSARRLLQITVPFSMLYEPKRLFPALCHELAHYIGERCRMRSLRFDVYCKCLASLFLQYFFPDCTGGIRQFHEYLNRFIRDVLCGGVEANESGVSVQEEPLLKIAAVANRLAEKLATAEGFTRFTKRYLEDSKQESNPAFFTFPVAEGLSTAALNFKKRNQDLRIVFRETFADVCMLYLLEPTPEEYLEAVFPTNGGMNESTCLRMLLSLTAAGYTHKHLIDAVKKTSRLSSNQEKEEVQKRIEKLSGLFQEENLYNYLKEYISTCWDTLQKCCPPLQPETEAYQNAPIAIYSRIVKDRTAFDHRMVLLDIDQSRKEILNDLRTR